PPPRGGGRAMGRFVARVQARRRQNPPQTILLLARGVRTAGVEPLVAVDEIRAIGPQPLHEDASYLAAEMQRDPAHADRARFAGSLEDALDLARVVVDAG